MTSSPKALRSAESPAPENRILSEVTDSPADPIARLAELRDEAAETAELANLLGRIPYLVAGLAIAAGLQTIFARAGTLPLLTWFVLLGAGLIALARTYRLYIGAPFELKTLQTFSSDLAAVMLYIGFAWGSTGYLLLPSNADFLQELAFGAATSALVLIALRSLRAVVYFVIPSALLSAAAVIGGPGVSVIRALLCVFVLGAVPVGAAYLAGRLSRRLGQPLFAAFPHI